MLSFKPILDIHCANFKLLIFFDVNTLSIWSLLAPVGLF